MSRRALFFALYACEGAPIGFIWWAMPAKLREAGVGVDRITELTALLVLPWALKFLWAPLVDRLRGARSHTAVIVTAQLGMAATLLPLPFIDLATRLDWVGILLFSHAFFAATQDVAIDALAVHAVPIDERGSVNGWMQAGMLLGRSVFGGGALALERWVGFTGVVVGVVVWVLAFGSLAARAPRMPLRKARPLWPDLRAALRRRTTWLGLGVALIAGAGFEAVGALAGPFLIDRGETSARVGVLLFLPAAVAMTIGALVGGRLADRVGKRRATAFSVVLVALAVLALAAIALAGAAGAAPIVALVVVYVGIGLLTATSYALLMDLTDRRLAATQFSAYMGATNGCEAWSGWLAGRLVSGAGYGSAFSVMALLSLLVLPLLRAMPGRTYAARS